ncbi:ATP-dependent DNA helicase pif1-like [Hydra vulgaris]|uniref:ATP-dependent DNA helicase pif1-like n=1 Tax=Hydra vulgaris TaxID=6087 RepID=A0ABM4D9B9_HYDVU
MLSKLQKRQYVYESKIVYRNGYVNAEWPFQTPNTVTLKKGAPVICLRNLPDLNLANGTQAIIVKLKEDYIVILTRDNSKLTIHLQKESLFNNKHNIVAECIGMPFTVAYAMTIHKVQGLTLDNVVIHINREQFTHHLFYVAMSRQFYSLSLTY